MSPRIRVPDKLGTFSPTLALLPFEVADSSNFDLSPSSEAPVRVYSAGYRVEQEFHTPERSYGFGVEEKRVLERSNVPRPDNVPIVVERPFEGRTEISPLRGIWLCHSTSFRIVR